MSTFKVDFKTTKNDWMADFLGEAIHKMATRRASIIEAWLSIEGANPDTHTIVSFKGNTSMHEDDETLVLVPNGDISFTMYNFKSQLSELKKDYPWVVVSTKIYVKNSNTWRDREDSKDKADPSFPGSSD